MTSYVAYHADFEIMSVYHSEHGAAILDRDEVYKVIGRTRMVESESDERDPRYRKPVMVEVEIDLCEYDLTEDDKKQIITYCHKNHLFI